MNFNYFYFKLAALFFLLLLPFSQAVPAAQPGVSGAPGATGKPVVTKVTSDAMVYDSNARKVIFSKQVTVVHPDFTLTSEQLELYLAGDGKTSGSGALAVDAGKVERIVARVKVQISMPQNRTASCETATYTVKDEILRMEGNPVLREDGNKLSGDVILFYFIENKSEAEGNVKVDFESKERSGSQ